MSIGQHMMRVYPRQPLLRDSLNPLERERFYFKQLRAVGKGKREGIKIYVG